MCMRIAADILTDDKVKDLRLAEDDAIPLSVSM